MLFHRQSLRGNELCQIDILKPFCSGKDPFPSIKVEMM